MNIDGHAKNIIMKKELTRACSCCDPRCRSIMRIEFRFYDDGTFDCVDDAGTALTIYQPDPPTMRGITVGMNQPDTLPLGLGDGGSVRGTHALGGRR